MMTVREIEPRTNFLGSLRVQLRIIGALMLREAITRYGRNNIGILWVVAEPMMFTLGVTALWSFTKVGHGAELGIAAFALTGYTSVLLWRNPVNRAINAVETNNALRYHRNVRPLDIIIARSTLEVVGVVGSFALLVLALVASDLAAVPAELDRLCAAIFLQAIFGIALALLVGAMTQLSEFAERIWHVFTYLIFPLSGTVFMLDWIPERMRLPLSFVPMVHGSEAIRHAYFGGSVRTHESELYLASAAGLMLLAALFALKYAAATTEVE